MMALRHSHLEVSPRLPLGFLERERKEKEEKKTLLQEERWTAGEGAEEDVERDLKEY